MHHKPNFRNRSLADAKLGTNCCLRQTAFAQREYGRGRSGTKLGSRVMRPDIATGPTLCVTVTGIVCLGAKKQVIRTNAWRVVAFMQNAHATIDFPVFKHPGNPMRGRLPNVANFPWEASVAERAPASLPGPASIGLVDIRPKPAEPALEFVDNRSRVYRSGAPGALPMQLADAACAVFPLASINRACSRKARMPRHEDGFIINGRLEE